MSDGERGLRVRAAAAISRRRLEERLKKVDEDRIRCNGAEARLSSVLGIMRPVVSLPVELDGLLFEAEPGDGEWLLILLQECPGCHQPESRRLIRQLADLGAALESKPAYCAKCDD